MVSRRTRIGVIVVGLAAAAFALTAPAAWGEPIASSQVAETGTDPGGPVDVPADGECLADSIGTPPLEPEVGLALAAYTADRAAARAARMADEPEVVCNGEKSRYGVDIDDKAKKLTITVKPRPDDGKCVIVNTKVFVTENLGGGKLLVTEVKPKENKNGELESIDVPYNKDVMLVVISIELKCGNNTVKPKPITFQFDPAKGKVTVTPAK